MGSTHKGHICRPTQFRRRGRVPRPAAPRRRGCFYPQGEQPARPRHCEGFSPWQSVSSAAAGRRVIARGNDRSDEGIAPYAPQRRPTSQPARSPCSAGNLPARTFRAAPPRRGCSYPQGEQPARSPCSAGNLPARTFRAAPPRRGCSYPQGEQPAYPPVARAICPPTPP